MRKAVDVKQIIPYFTFRAELDIWIFSGRWSDIIKFNLIEHLLTACCLFGFRGVRTETGDEIFQFLNFLFFLLVLLLSHLLGKLAGLVPEIIVADIELDLSKVEVGDMGTYVRSEEHTSELQSRFDLVCRLLLEKKKY